MCEVRRSFTTKPDAYVISKERWQSQSEVIKRYIKGAHWGKWEQPYWTENKQSVFCDCQASFILCSSFTWKLAHGLSFCCLELWGFVSLIFRVFWSWKHAFEFCRKVWIAVLVLFFGFFSVVIFTCFNFYILVVFFAIPLIKTSAKRTELPKMNQGFQF